MRKRDKSSTSLAFYIFSSTRLIKSIKHEHSCKILYESIPDLCHLPNLFALVLLQSNMCFFICSHKHGNILCQKNRWEASTICLLVYFACFCRLLIFSSFDPEALVLLLLIRCWLLLPLWDSVIVPCFVVRYLVSILVLQSSWWGRESWLVCLVCLSGISGLMCGFLAAPRVCLQFVIVVFRDHTPETLILWF